MASNAWQCGKRSPFALDFEKGPKQNRGTNMKNRRKAEADSIKDVSNCHISPRRRLELLQLRARSMAWRCQWWYVSAHIKTYSTRWIFTFCGKKVDCKAQKFFFEKVVVEVEVVSTCCFFTFTLSQGLQVGSHSEWWLPVIKPTSNSTVRNTQPAWEVRLIHDVGKTIAAL